MPTMPIMKPKLPAMERLAPYMRRIDSARTYSNFGPLACLFEERLSAHYRLGSETIATVANGTLGLVLALMAQNPRPGSLCIMPAWTFIASAHAAVMAGLVPYFVDVDPETWMLDASTVASEVARAPGTVGAVMPVSAFGRPIDISQWDHFRSHTRLPVVVDAAAGFDSITAGETPVVVSLHATKIIGVGEGGFLMSTDTSLIRDIHARSNFGFQTSRQATVPSTNAKLSEYHAAVGLAALDEWDGTRGMWIAAARTYRELLSKANRIRFQEGFGEHWITSTCVLQTADLDADKIESQLAAANIGTRRWWGRGAHTHPATCTLPRTAVPNTEALAHSTIAVPLYQDIKTTEIEYVAERILATL